MGQGENKPYCLSYSLANTKLSVAQSEHERPDRTQYSTPVCALCPPRSFYGSILVPLLGMGQDRSNAKRGAYDNAELDNWQIPANGR